MFRYEILVLIILLLTSCNLTKRYYIKGEYDRAIAKGVKKIKKNPHNQKVAIYLEKSYNAANKQDMERLKFLKIEGRPENWIEILNIYITLKSRQSMIQTVTPLKIGKKTVSFQYIDYDKDIANAKQNAAEYWYVTGKKLLASGDRYKAREAYKNFKNIKNYYENYQDVDNLIIQSLRKGLTKVNLLFANNTFYKLSDEFKNQLFNFDLHELNSLWVRYFHDMNNYEHYHYLITLNLKSIIISPEKVVVRESIKTKKIEDGTEVVLDNNNNVVKDSLGNPITKPKIIEVSCKLIETVQQKAAHLEGEVTYFDVEKRSEITKQPIKSDYFFEHITLVANGDLRALDEETKKRLGYLPIPFPSDMEMILGATTIFKQVFFDLLKDNNFRIK